MKEFTYNREMAVAYARKWAFARNPVYYNFDSIGGDCTNFISQCIYAGCGVMNYTKTFGWYYKSPAYRSPSWTGVEYLFDFLVRNNSFGPYGVECAVKDVIPGDIIQLDPFGTGYHHSLIVVEKHSSFPWGIFIATHTYDSFNRPLSDYNVSAMRAVHIDMYRK